MKKKVIIYGIGRASSKYLKNIEEEWEIVAVSDRHSKCEIWNGYPFIEPSQLKDYEYDYVVVPSSKYYSEICTDLEKIGVDKERIIKGWYKNVSEFSYWKKMQEQEGNFVNDKYKEVMLCLAEEDNDDFLKGKIVADFGCGPRGSLAWTDKPLMKIGIDVLIQEYMKIIDLSKHGVVYVTAKEDKIPMPDECVDYIMALEVLDRVTDIKITLSEIARILKTGGIFAGSFPLNEPLYEDDGQPQSFDKKVINLLKNNYDVVSVRIAKRALNTGEYFEPYSHMLHGQYADDLKENEKGFLWFRAIKINKSTDEK